MRGGRAAIAVVALLALLGVPGCTGDQPGGSPSTATRPATAVSTTMVPDRGPGARTATFAVDVPEGFEPVVADAGSSAQEWDSDLGSDLPFTAFLPFGSDDPDDLVRVEIEAIDPRAHPDVDEPTLDVYAEGRMAQLSDRSWGDVSLQVRGPARYQDVFADLLASARWDEADHGRAPEVGAAPDGWRRLGHVDADLLVAMNSWLQPMTDRVPGLPTAHALGWRGAPDVRGQRAQLVVLAVPGDAADLDAVLGTARLTDESVRRIEVGGRPGVVVEGSNPARVTVVTEAPWGDLLVVVGRDGGPSVDALVRVAASARTVDEAAWEAQRVAAFGGGGRLGPEAGRVVLAEGEHDGVRWLLQDDGAGAPDWCLRLSTWRRTCLSASGGTDGWAASSGPDPQVGDLYVAATQVAGASVRVTVGEEIREAPLVPIPGGPLSVAVVADLGLSSAGSGFTLCRETRRPSDVTMPRTLVEVRVDVLDDAGAVVGCFDPFGPT